MSDTIADNPITQRTTTMTPIKTLSPVNHLYLCLNIDRIIAQQSPLTDLFVFWLIDLKKRSNSHWYMDVYQHFFG